MVIATTPEEKLKTILDPRIDEKLKSVPAPQHTTAKDALMLYRQFDRTLGDYPRVLKRFDEKLDADLKAILIVAKQTPGNIPHKNAIRARAQTAQEFLEIAFRTSIENWETVLNARLSKSAHFAMGFSAADFAKVKASADRLFKAMDEIFEALKSLEEKTDPRSTFAPEQAVSIFWGRCNPALQIIEEQSTLFLRDIERFT